MDCVSRVVCVASDPRERRTLARWKDCQLGGCAFQSATPRSQWDWGRDQAGVMVEDPLEHARKARLLLHGESLENGNGKVVRAVWLSGSHPVINRSEYS